MNTYKKLRLIIFAIFICVKLAYAQESHQHHHDTTEKLGQVSFSVSCGSAVQQKFNRALALLHSFQYPDAELAF
ncbi:MAG TPA: hypothetical protein VEF04_20155, partial [Blastocatellia bacterium]|nr:hypothetical protein [Blastocatellia bacterium]